MQRRRAVAESIASGASGNQRAKKQKIAIEEVDMPLWLKLKACRKRLADENNVPAFVVFSDATLQEMLINQPCNQAQMLAISGIGITKFERFGDAFLAVLTEFH